MKEIRKTSQFKKDYKRFSKDLNKVKLLFSIVEILQMEKTSHQSLNLIN